MPKELKLPDVRWSDLGAIGRSPAVRLTILIPLLGYMLLLNYDFLNFIQLVSTQTWAKEGTTLAPPIKLIFTYLGLCCLGLASAIFVLRCPEGPRNFASEGAFIKSINEVGDPGADFLRFNYVCHKIQKGLMRGPLSQGEFIAISRSSTSLQSISEWIAENGIRPEPYTTKDLVSEVTNNRGVNLSFINQIKKVLLDERAGLSGAWFAIQDMERPKSRNAVLILYSLGFLFLALPTISTVIEIILAIAGVNFGN